jgi:PAS domain S-box-containing protein
LKREAKLKAILESSPEAITVTDLNGNIIEFNQATVALHGYESKEELIGKNSLELIAKQDHKRAIEGLKETLEHGSTKNLEYTFLTKDGREFQAELSASVVRDASGKPEYFMAITKDITKRKKAEEALRESMEIYRDLAESISDMFFVMDKDFRYTYWNKASEELTGISAKDAVGKSLTEVFPDVKGTRVEQFYKEALRTQQPQSFLNKYQLKGKDYVFELNAYPTKTGVSVFVKDFTERQKMDDEIKSLARFPSENPNPVLRLNREGNILYANNPGKALLQDWKHEVADRTPEFLRGVVAETLSKQSEKSFDLKLGKRVYSITVTPVMGSDYANIYGTDITERKKAEEELKSSEQKVRGLVEDSAAAIATIDLKGRLTYVNKALADLLGYSVQEMSGRAFKDFVHPDDRGRLVRLFLKIIVLRRPPRKFEFRALRKDGAILHLMCRPTRLETAGKTVGFQAIVIDNTAEKRMLERAEKMNEKLSVVGGLTRHDVNNKLSTILSTSYLLRQRLRDNQSLELVEETESAVHQIEGLFEFARIYEKLGTEELVYVDAEKVFNEAARLFPRLKDIKIVNDCHGLTVFADSLLRQLFYNLVDNSLKHGEKLSRIRVFYEEKNDHLNVIYEDDGVGIPQAAKPKLFDEGYTTGKGSSHGLYLVKKMMEVYGWIIQEVGTPGKGAKFTIIIPRTNQNGKENYRLH